jgi:hypothetical protein
LSQTSCSGTTIGTIALSGTVSGTVYNWTRDNVVNVTGIAASGSGNISGTLTNVPGTPQSVNFVVIPSYTNAGVTCQGSPITATVAVNKAPVVTCPANITVPSDQGQCGAIVNYPAATVTGTLTPAVNYSKPSGSFFPGGTTTVTVTATNSCGTSSCTFTVTVNAPVVTIPPVYAVPPPGGAPNVIYKTYGPQSLNLTANVAGGAATATYSWNGPSIVGSTTGQTINVAPTAVGSYVYNVSVSSNGCTSTATTTVKVYNISCGGNKVSLCQTSTTTTICLGAGWVPGYLANGYTLGACGSIVGTTIEPGEVSSNGNEPTGVAVSADKFEVVVSPNPSQIDFRIQVRSASNSLIRVRLFDDAGRVLEVVENGSSAGVITVGRKLPAGTYFAEVMQGENKKVVKLVKR